MKNNKGYTLVELLVSLALLAMIMAQIGNMLANTSIIYKNGTYEVGLQTESQQVMQLMNELLIDANGEVRTVPNPFTGSDDIVISSNGAEYLIVLTKDDPADEYGSLYYTKNAIAPTVSDPTPGPVLMAEHVQSISLNMAGYDLANMITVSVSMNDGKYSYVANEPVWLRNPIGTGLHTNYTSEGSYKYAVDVLRHRSYDLSKLCDEPGKHYTYAWDPADATSAQLAYNLSGTTISAKSTTTNETMDAVGPFILIGTDASGGTIKIQISSEKVDFGTNSVGILYGNKDTGAGTFPLISATPVHGIDVSEADSYEITYVHEGNMTSGSDSTTFSSLPYNMGDLVCRYDYASTFSEPKLNGVQFSTNKAVNTFDITSTLFDDSQGGGYVGYLTQANKPLSFHVILHYTTNGSMDVEGDVYVYNYKANMGTAAETVFWNAIGW